ncbi:UNVERIFIED_CONTAM: hypothetical protein HDU68_000091 [Siphonaria sp. JEL0065]|nr:hypothetical protein HDU68_000091 [Siphonaria sp. JEL0065]
MTLPRKPAERWTRDDIDSSDIEWKFDIKAPKTPLKQAHETILRKYVEFFKEHITNGRLPTYPKPLLASIDKSLYLSGINAVNELTDSDIFKLILGWYRTSYSGGKSFVEAEDFYFAEAVLSITGLYVKDLHVLTRMSKVDEEGELGDLDSINSYASYDEMDLGQLAKDIILVPEQEC